MIIRDSTPSGTKVPDSWFTDLSIESLQDTATYAESSKNSSAGVSLCLPPLCYGASSVSVGAGKTKIDSDYQSVNGQSGLKAGDGGFQVAVAGDTTLKGGTITSTDQAVGEGKNQFSTGGTLSLSDLHNTASYEADGYQINASVSGQLGDQSTARTDAQKAAANAPAKPGGSAGVGSDSGSASSTTQAAITGIAGDSDARTGDAETGLKPIFGKDKVKTEVQDQVAVTQAFGQQATKAAASYAGNKAAELRREGNEEEAAKWDEGGEYRVLMHGGIGLLTGGLEGAAGAAASAYTMPKVGELIDEMDLPQAVKQGLGMVASAAVGAVAGGSAGAAAGFNTDTNNRQLHPNERKRAKELADKSGGKYTVEQIENAMRNAANTETGESVVAGMVVDPKDRNAIYDKGAVWTVGENGSLIQVLPPQPDAGLTAFIQQHTGQTYDWYVPSSQAATINNGPKDRLTNLPLDDQGRYSQTVVLGGKAYEPKYFSCATTECMRQGANLDLSDPNTQAYVKAMHAQIFKDIGTGAAAGTLITPVGVAGAVLAATGGVSAVGSAMTDSTLVDEMAKEGAQIGTTKFLEGVLQHSPASAARIVSLIDLTGGWDSFVSRVRKDFGWTSNDQEK